MNKSILGIIGIILVADQIIGIFYDFTIDFTINQITSGVASNADFQPVPLFAGIILIVIGFMDKFKLK